jgi:hypothetical protein
MKARRPKLTFEMWVEEMPTPASSMRMNAFGSITLAPNESCHCDGSGGNTAGCAVAGLGV